RPHARPLPRRPLRQAKVLAIANDSRVLPQDCLERARHDNVRRAAGEVGVLDLALGSGSAGEWQDAAAIAQPGVPVLLVAGIHAGTEDVRVDVADDIVRDPALALAPTTGPRSRTAAAAGAREAVSRGGLRSSVPPVRRERSLGTSPRAARSGRRPPRASLAAPSGRRR